MIRLSPSVKSVHEGGKSQKKKEERLNPIHSAERCRLVVTCPFLINL